MEPKKRRLTKRKRMPGDGVGDEDATTLRSNVAVPNAEVAWAVMEGAAFKKGDALGTLSAAPSDSAVETVLAPLDGTMLKHFLLPGSGGGGGGVVGAGAALCLVRLCRHPAAISGLCAVCGRAVEGSHLKRVTLSGHVSELTVDQDEARACSSIEQLKAEKKLQLILDIDNTLLECTSKEPPPGIPGIQLIRLYGTRPHWIKRRPGLDAFLRQACAKFQMTLYTNGKVTKLHVFAALAP